MFQISVESSDYSDVNLINTINQGKINIKDPSYFYGFYHNDVVQFDGKDKPLKLLNRAKNDNIAGILELFGTYSFKPNKRGVPGYLFRPLDRSYPIFIVRSKLKRKSTENQLVTIEIASWEPDEKIPYGNIVRHFGNISDIDAVCQALLFRFNVFPNKSNYNLSKFEPVFDFSGRTEITLPIYSIDPKGCEDIDDAFSLDANKLYIHISDVYSFLSKNSLLDKINNITSIYLINSKVLHAIDTHLASNWCSLKARTTRYMLTLEIDLNNMLFKFYPSYGKITHNYSYENYNKEINDKFTLIAALFHEYMGYNKVVKDSHQFIEAMMIIYNHLYVENLKNLKKSPIYRVQDVSEEKYSEEEGELYRFLNIINSKSANYSWEDIGHAHLGINNGYSHTTSPIRRLVDLLNQEIYYGGNILLEKFTLEDINEYNNLLKKYYRKQDLVKLVDIIQHKEYEEVECYIYEFVDNCLQIYIPKYGVNISYRIIDRKMEDLYEIQRDDFDLTIKKESEQFKCKLGQLTKIKMYGKLNISNLNGSLKLDLFS